MKKQLTILLFLSLVLIIISFNCLSAQASASPIITSISPSPFYENDTLTINGENFGSHCSATVYENRIILNDYSIYSNVCDDWTDNKITKFIYVNQESGYIQIKTADGSLSNKFDFVVLQRNPIISSIYTARDLSRIFYHYKR